MDVRRISTITLALALPACFSPNEALDPAESDTDPAGTTTTAAGSESGAPNGESTGTTAPESTTGSTTLDETTTGEGMDDTSTSDDPSTTGDPNPMAVCGDGMVEGEEDCDDAELNGVSGMSDCLEDCTLTTCGDGFLGLPETEECDQGDDNADDAACTAACAVAVCGDELVGPGESCDDGVGGSDLCTPACVLASCGDGIIQDGEDCDDENESTTDACVNCVFASCGDGFVEAGEEQCDDGAGNASEPIVCAYGVTDDDCTYCAASSCSVEQGITSFCGDGEIQAGSGEGCDDGAGNTSTAPTCAYGVEEADCTYCDATSCSTEVGNTSYCGDGVLQAGEGEECDDGDEVDGDGCNADCLPSGLQLWTYEEHASSEDLCVDIVATSGSHVFLAAQADNVDGGDEAHVFYVQRLSEMGSADWTAEYAPFATATTHDYRPYAAVDAGDGVVVVGGHRTQIGSVINQLTDARAVKFAEADGAVVWGRSDNGPDFAVDVVPDGSGGFAIVALTNNDFDTHLYRVSADGDLVGPPVVDPDAGDWVLERNPAGGYVSAAGTLGFGTGVVERRNDGFSVLWSYQLTTPPGRPADLAIEPGGRIFAAASSWIAELDQDTGVEEWVVMTSEVAALGFPSAIEVAANGDLVLAGRRDGAPWVARLAPDGGGTLWAREVSEDGLFSSVAVRPDGVVVACGHVDAGGQGDNIFVAAYSP